MASPTTQPIIQKKKKKSSGSVYLRPFVFPFDVGKQKMGNESSPVSRLEIGNRKTENEPLSDFLLCVYLTQVGK